MILWLLGGLSFIRKMPAWVWGLALALLAVVMIWNAGVNHGKGVVREEWIAAEAATLRIVEEAKDRAEDEIPPLTAEDRLADSQRPGVGIPCRVYDPYDRDCPKDRRRAH